jgi:NOL1/NOP2/fmu family ribosome biogenesis protein
MKTVTFDETKWKLVPLEPTYEMLDGAYEGISLSTAHTNHGVEAHVYHAFISRAPEHKEE